MENWILAVDNNYDEFEAVQKEWLKHHVFVKMIKSMPEALKLLMEIDFLLVIVAGDNIAYLPYLKLMRDMKPIPILVLSSKYNASEKIEAILLGADEYLPYPSTVEEDVASGRALIRRYTVLTIELKNFRSLLSTTEYIQTVRDVGYRIKTI